MSRPEGKTDGRLRGAYDAAWEQAAREICSAGLRGLNVQCPACHEFGALTSKWEPKTPTKPLFVIHSNGDDRFEACALDKEQADAARGRVRFTGEDVLETFKLGKAFVLFSGGKDSICALWYVNQIAKKAGVQVTALHADTTAGFPEVERYVKEVCQVLAIPLVVVRPPEDYFDLAKRWGVPGFNSRWCCETLKIAPIRRFLSTHRGPKVVYDGIRGAESNLRAKYVPVWFHPSFRCVSVSPILQWSNKDVAEYLASVSGLPDNPAGGFGTSGECWCGAYKCKTDFKALLRVHPEIFAKLVEVEEARGGKYTFLYENGRQVPLSTLEED